MRIGLSYDFANPAPWRRDEAEFLNNEIDQIVWADSLGIDGAWITEHHFVDSYLCAPLAILAALATRTKRIRLGTSITVTPLYHPVRLAEDLAVIDVLSRGRLEWGAGIGWSVEEFKVFGVDPSKRVGRTREIIEIVKRAWTEEAFSFHGQHFDFASVRVVPKPVQKPHPPILAGATSLAAAQRVGRWGLPMQWINREMGEAYLEAYAAAGHPIEQAAIDGHINLFACDDPEALWPQVRDHYLWQSNRNRGHLRATAGGGQETRPHDTLADLDRAREKGSLIFGTPDQVVEAVKRLSTGLPVKGIVCHNRVCGMPDEISNRHVELMACVVGPALRDL